MFLPNAGQTVLSGQQALDNTSCSQAEVTVRSLLTGLFYLQEDTGEYQV